MGLRDGDILAATLADALAQIAELRLLYACALDVAHAKHKEAEAYRVRLEAAIEDNRRLRKDDDGESLTAREFFASV